MSPTTSNTCVSDDDLAGWVEGHGNVVNHAVFEYAGGFTAASGSNA